MLYHSIALLTLLSCSFNTRVLAQKNVTVNETDTSIIFENAGDAIICKYGADGNIVAGQAGCYNLKPSECADSVAMSQNESASATFKFKGSAIYINSLMYMFSPLYTVTLDGNATDVDGYDESRFFVCDRPLWSQTGLDPTVEHEITLATKGPSPSSNETDSSSSSGIFSLISFVYTAEDGANSSATGTGSSTTGTSTASGSSESDTDGATASILSMAQVAFGLILAFGVGQICEVL